jgi:hypothetical protein
MLLYWGYQTSTSKTRWFVQLTETKVINSCILHGTGNALSGGAVAGIVIACIVILIVGIWLVFIYYRRQKMRKAKSLPCPEDSVQLGNEKSLYNFIHIQTSCSICHFLVILQPCLLTQITCTHTSCMQSYSLVTTIMWYVGNWTFNSSFEVINICFCLWGQYYLFRCTTCIIIANIIVCLCQLVIPF